MRESRGGHLWLARRRRRSLRGLGDGPSQRTPPGGPRSSARSPHAGRKASGCTGCRSGARRSTSRSARKAPWPSRVSNEPSETGPALLCRNTVCGGTGSLPLGCFMVRPFAGPFHRLCPGRGDAGLIGRPAPYYPTVKSILFSTVPDASLTSTCQAPVHSAGTVFRLHVRHGDPLTCSSTSPTSV